MGSNASPCAAAVASASRHAAQYTSSKSVNLDSLFNSGACTAVGTDSNGAGEGAYGRPREREACLLSVRHGRGRKPGLFLPPPIPTSLLSPRPHPHPLPSLFAHAVVWVSVDLGYLGTVSAVTVEYSTTRPGPGSYAAFFVSNDPIAGSFDATSQGQQCGGNHTADLLQNAGAISAACNVSGRYVSFVIFDAEGGTLCDFEVFLEGRKLPCWACYALPFLVPLLICRTSTTTSQHASPPGAWYGLWRSCPHPPTPSPCTFACTSLSPPPEPPDPTHPSRLPACTTATADVPAVAPPWQTPASRTPLIIGIAIGAGGERAFAAGRGRAFPSLVVHQSALVLGCWWAVSEVQRPARHP